MKRFFISLLAAPVLIACSDIDTDNRYLETESVAPVRAVIIEDFTGQNCVNCPAAHATMERLTEQYGDQVIPVGIHAGNFGVSVESTHNVGLMQPEGNTYNDRYGIDEWPKGVIDRRSGPRNHDEWPGLVREELQRPAPLGIEVEASLSADGENIEIHTTLKPDENIDGRLQLWVLEDHIIAFQRDIDLGRIAEYEHNHVYRAAVNGIDGEPVALQHSLHKEFDHSIAVRRNPTETWVPANLSVVAFVFNDDGVQQAAKAYVSVPVE